jgi:transglutaminase-like putative cysteine protease
MMRLRLIFAVVLFLLASDVGFGSEPNPRSRTFQLNYQATIRDIPRDAKRLEAWVPLPQSDLNQTVHQVSIRAPAPVTLGREPRFGNQSVHVRIDRPQGPVQIALVIEATRRVNSGHREALSTDDRRAQLAPEPLVPLDGPIRELAASATNGMTTDEERARAIYDKVTSMMRYDKSGTGWGRGDALFACSAKRGNCTDFHALLIGMARSAGIPARFAIGLPIPESAGSGEIPGYHCWAELYVDGRGWIPVDSSEASKNPAKREYYFGHHDQNRLEFSRGRNLGLVPAQQGPGLNFFVYPYAELDGKSHDGIDHKFTFTDREQSSLNSRSRAFHQVPREELEASTHRSERHGGPRSQAKGVQFSALRTRVDDGHADPGAAAEIESCGM